MPKIPLPECTPVHGETSFRLDDREQALFDGIAQEHTRIIGTECELYALNKKKSKRDPLYDEAIKEKYDGPFKVSGFVTYPEAAPEAREEGFRNVKDCTVWFSRKDLDDLRVPYPAENDIVRFWKHPYFKSAGVEGLNVPNAGYYFDVVDVDEDGHLFDNAGFVGFKCDLRRRTEYTPERRISPP